MLVKVENNNGVLVTTSNRVSEELGVLHKDLLEKIDKYTSKFSSAEVSAQFYIPSNYVSSNGRTVRNYLITKKGIAQLVGGYSSAVEKAFELNVAYINEFEKMEEFIRSKTPRTFAEALRLAADQAEQIEKLELDNKIKQQRILEMEPKENYYDKILQSKELLTITQIAKDYGMTGIEMNQKLKELDVQYKQGKIWLLKEKHQTQGYTKTKTVPFVHSDGTPDSNTYTCWTQKGRLFLYDLLKQNKILPLIEREEVDE